MARGRMFEENDFNSLPAESDYMSPFAVQPSYVPAPVASPLAVQPSYAPMGGDYDLSPEVLAQLADLGVNPYGEGQAPMSNPVSSPLAVRGMPEMDPAEFSSLAVPGVPPAVQEQARADLLADPNVTILPGSLDDLSRFGGLGGLDGYEANSSGAPQGMPTSYAFPENYGNPKNKIYNLTAGPEDNIRLKFVDGTTMFEGKGPEAAAKAAAMVQELGKKFNTQSTWILDKQTAGGDWKQVSQDTVGDKKKTALNSFLDVAAPIAGALLAVVPGLGLLAAPGLLGGAGAGLGLSTATAGALGAAGGSLLNSGLQNQNSAEAFKKAALAAASTYIGAKVGSAVSGGGGISPTSLDPTSAVGIRNLAAKGFSPEKIAGLATAAGESLTAAEIQTIITAGATKAATTGLASAAGDVVIKGLTTGAGTAGAVVGGTAAAGLAGAGGLTSGTSGVTNAATNTATNTTAETQSGLDAVNDVQVMGEGTPVDTNVGLEIAGGLGGNGITSGVNPDFVSKPNDAELEIEARKKAELDRVTGVPATQPGPLTTTQPTTPTNPVPDETVIEADKKPVEEPLKPTTTTGPLTTTQPTTPTNPVPDETVIEADKDPVKEPLTPTPVVTPTQPTTPVNPVPETIEVPMPKKEEPVILPDGTLNPKFVDTPAPVVPPTAPPTAEPLPETTTPFDPKTLLPYILPLIGGLGGAGGGGSGGSGVNTLGYPGGTQPGTPGSLTDIFRTKLPTPNPALAVTPRDMGQRDWLRYGFGPEASFFSNVPDRQALAVNPAPVAQTSPAAQTSPLEVKPNPAPVIEEMPALSEKLNEPASDLMVKPEPERIPVIGGPGYEEYANAKIAAMTPEEKAANQAAIKKSYEDALNGGPMYAKGGSIGHGTSRKPRTEFAVHGAGTGRSDDIPAVLSDGEYVMDAETVALLGDGSSKAGAEKLDQLRVNLRRHKGANLAKGRFSVNAKSPEKYLAGGRV